MSKRRKVKRKSMARSVDQTAYLMKRALKERGQPTGGIDEIAAREGVKRSLFADGVAKSAAEVTREVFKKMPDESPDLPEHDLAVNVAVRQRLEADTQEMLDDLVAEDAVTRYVDDEGVTRYYATEDQAILLETKRDGGMPSVAEIGRAQGLGRDALESESRLRPGTTVPQSVIDGLAGLPDPNVVASQLVPMSDAARRLEETRAMVEGEPLRMIDGTREEVRLRRDDGSIKGLGGDDPIGDLVRRGPALDAAVDALNDPTITDEQKAVGLVREYLGADAAVEFMVVGHDARLRMLSQVRDVAKLQRELTQAELDQATMDRSEIEAKIVAGERLQREIRQLADPVEPYRRSEWLAIETLRRDRPTAADLQRMLELSQRLHPVLTAADAGEITNDEMAARVRAVMDERDE